MKKVWILEGFISREKMEEELEDLYTSRDLAKTEDQIKACDEIMSIHKKTILKHPEGYWVGYQGKSIYHQFCTCAKDTLRNMKDVIKKWRVVEAEINDDAQVWVGYKIVKENPGVMRYLWATL